MMINQRSLLTYRSLFNKKAYLFFIPVLVIAIASSFLLTKQLATAQNAGQGLEVSPPSQEVSVDPGGTVTVKAKIRNRSNTSLPMEVHIEDFTAKGEEGQVELNANSPYSVASWGTVNPKTFTLEAGEEQEVTATLKAPNDAAGGHFGSFVFAAKNDQPSGNTAGLSQAIASLFLVRVSGTVDEKLSMKDFRAPAFSEFGPVPFELKFENSGNVHVAVGGLIGVTDMFGKKIADIVVPGTNVFPGASRIVRPSLDQQFLFGPYTATAVMYYGSGNQNLTQTMTFYVFPLRIAIGVAIVLFILYLMRKRLKKSLKALFK